MYLAIPVDTGRKLNVHKPFRRRPGRLLNVLSTFNLRPVSIGQWEFGYCLLTNLPRIIVARDFFPTLFKLRRGILPLFTKYVS